MIAISNVIGPEVPAHPAHRQLGVAPRGVDRDLEQPLQVRDDVVAASVRGLDVRSDDPRREPEDRHDQPGNDCAVRVGAVRRRETPAAGV